MMVADLNCIIATSGIRIRDPIVDDSSDVEEKGSIATICMLMALIMFIPLVIIVLIVALVVKSRRGKTERSEE